MSDVLVWQWIVLIAFSFVLILMTPYVKTKEGFFKGTSKKLKQPGTVMLTFSLVISWIFAKSVTNAANLGLNFGIVGGVAYATYYFSFLVAGIVIYKIRTKLNVRSLHEFLEKKFGVTAVKVFTLIIAIRLLNEVWSNTEVIGTYFGPAGSSQYIISIAVFTALTLLYALKGGLRSSLITDLLQMVLFAVLVFIVLSVIIPKTDSVKPLLTTGEWTLKGGLDLVLVALIQIFSYPFHDPVLTDRGFISNEKVTLKSYIFSSIAGIIFILLFSFVGIYAKLFGLQGQAAVEVSKTFGAFMMIIMNFIMITSASSTVDSTFASVSKLIVVDLRKEKFASLNRGRIVMILTAIVGTIPLFFSPTILSATTISGTMVLGFAPVFIFWKYPAPKISFHLAVWTGVIAGAISALELLPKSFFISTGTYAGLLGLNVYATVLILVVYFVPVLVFKYQNKLVENNLLFQKVEEN
jgi:solute:Na+ symporter, SSS family